MRDRVPAIHCYRSPAVCFVGEPNYALGSQTSSRRARTRALPRHGLSLRPSRPLREAFA
jgi:hypothetical protein